MRQAQLFRYTLPVETGVILRNHRLKQREGLIVKLQENEHIGWGEIAPLPEFSLETLAQAENETQIWLQKWLKGENPILENCAPSIAFGLSFALAELHQTLNEAGNYHSALLCYGDPDELYEALNALNGEKVGKMKVGLYEANRDGLIANMMLEALPDLHLRLDANRSWGLEKAVKFAEKITNAHKARIQFLEEPCKTPTESRQFAAQTGIAIAWDETVREPDFVVKKEENLTAIIIKPTLVGSWQKCLSLIEQAHEQGLMAVISSSIESSLGLTQLARFAQQFTPNVTPGLDTLNLMKAQLLRAWQGSTLPLMGLESELVEEISLATA